MPDNDQAVTQADRELFIFLLGFDVMPCEGGFQRILDGEFDKWEKMQRIACHRIAASTAERDVEGLREALGIATAALRIYAEPSGYHNTHGEAYTAEDAHHPGVLARNTLNEIETLAALPEHKGAE